MTTQAPPRLRTHIVIRAQADDGKWENLDLSDLKLPIETAAVWIMNLEADGAQRLALSLLRTIRERR